MISFVRVTLAATALLAAPASAADSPPKAANGEGAATKAPQTVAKEKLICTREIPVGSTIPRKTCRTAAQVDQDRAEARKMREQTGTGAGLITPR